MEEYCWVYHVGRRIIWSIFTCSSCLQPNSTWDFPGLGTAKWQGYQPVVHWHDPASSSSFCTWRLGHVWGFHWWTAICLPGWSRATGTTKFIRSLGFVWKSGGNPDTWLMTENHVPSWNHYFMGPLPANAPLSQLENHSHVRCLCVPCAVMRACVALPKGACCQRS